MNLTIKKFIFFLFFSLILLSAGLLISFSTVTAQEPKEILLGTALPLTGKQSEPGIYFRKGYMLAVNQQNEKGGIFVKEFGKRLPVKLIIYDDKTDNTTSVGLYERLVTVDKVHALLGGYSTPLIFAHTVVPEKFGIPYINGGGAATEIYTRGFKWIFGTLSSIRALAHTLMDWLKLEQDKGRLPKPLKVASAWQDTAHGKDWKDGVLDKVKQYPGVFNLVLDEPFEFLAKDYTALMIKVKRANADIFISDTHLPDFILQHRQYKELGLYHKVVSYGARGPEVKARQTLGSAVDFLVSAQWWTADLPYSQSKKFYQDYKAVYKEDFNEWYPALAYETARVLFKAIEDAGSLNKEKIRQALVNMDFKNSIVPGERIRFSKDAGFQTVTPYVLVQNKPDGKTEIIYPESAVSGASIVPIPKK